MLSLVGVRRPAYDKLLLGWLGPTGLPSVILGLIALEQLTGGQPTWSVCWWRRRFCSAS